jgi:two-component system NtrC family sensor kinase
MVQAEKMSALGQMVAGIAHEINTPLAYVKGTFEVLREQVMMPVVAEPASQKANESLLMEDVDQLLKDGIHGIEQISEIVTNLKNFSRLDRARVSEFAVHEGLDSTLLLAHNLLKHHVKVHKNYGAVPKVHCSPSQINQVFLNIITNAVHAMPQGRAEPGVITLRTSVEGGNKVRIDIQDNGIGIPAGVLPRIFDPFFTTKEIGQGTGMGLSISYRIIQEHGGMILVDTAPDAGTVFSILLPILQRKAEAPAGIPASAPLIA